MNEYSSIEDFCEKRGFHFHTAGRGKWGAYPYWSLPRVEYHPMTGMVKLVGELGIYNGKVESVAHLLEILKALRISDESTMDESYIQKNRELREQRIKKMTSSVIAELVKAYGITREKAVILIKSNNLISDSTPISMLSNRCIGTLLSSMDENDVSNIEG